MCLVPSRATLSLVPTEVPSPCADRVELQTRRVLLSHREVSKPVSRSPLCFECCAICLPPCRCRLEGFGLENVAPPSEKEKIGKWMTVFLQFFSNVSSIHSCPCCRRQLEGFGLENVVAEASEVRMELAAMGSELLEKMARSPQVTSRLPAVRRKEHDPLRVDGAGDAGLTDHVLLDAFWLPHEV